ncbi:DUF7857 domain-containing protein [Halorubrum amylolyticum]|uniref:DUF7857 domain-containing protein n=1 Tax=Halorubrum amylolyticum TaxID=2508724 RepID=UPI001008C2C8|nr:hypothetical protein [Halorubrum amylolyticum]
MDLTWSVDREGGVSLVRCRIRNGDAVGRRVRIESLLDGPVLPPRRAGAPEVGWDESGVTLRLEPGERRAIGFAARASPANPPVEIREVETVEPAAGRPSTERAAEGAASATAEALRNLGDHRPPRDGVVGGEVDIGRGVDVGDRGGATEADGADGTGGEDTGPPTDRGAGAPAGADTDGESGVEAWLHGIEARIGRAERLTDADLATATEAVAEAGGLGGVAGLDERVAADASRLRELSERASTLATRAEATDAPVEALERLA